MKAEEEEDLLLIQVLKESEKSYKEDLELRRVL